MRKHRPCRAAIVAEGGEQGVCSEGGPTTAIGDDVVEAVLQGRAIIKALGVVVVIGDDVVEQGEDAGAAPRMDTSPGIGRVACQGAVGNGHNPSTVDGAAFTCLVVGKGAVVQDKCTCVGIVNSAASLGRVVVESTARDGEVVAVVDGAI